MQEYSEYFLKTLRAAEGAGVVVEKKRKLRMKKKMN